MEFIEIDKGNGKNFSNAVKGGAMVLFFSDGCGHCTDMKPQWNALKGEMNKLQEELNEPNVVSVNVNAVDEIDSKWHKHTHSVPTIIVVTKDGKDYDFNDERTTDNFVKFLKTHFSKDNKRSKPGVDNKYFDENVFSGGKRSLRRKSLRRKSPRRKSPRRKSGRRKSLRRKTLRRKGTRKRV